jgi:hypothetical protein
MRGLVQRSLAFALVALAALLSGRAFAQAEAPDEVTVRGQKTLTQYRLELERARDDLFKRFNDANTGKDTDITCRNEQPTGSRMRQNVCRSGAEDQADASAARGFLTSLLHSAGNYLVPDAPPGTQVAANIGTGSAQNAGQSGESDAMAKFEQEWRRILSEDREFYQAVVDYVALEDEYDRARGATAAIAEQDLRVPVAVTAGATGPQCEASTLTEYQQRNNVARVTGTVSISACPAGTSGTFTLVARVRDEAGEIKPIEFNEAWQRADAGDHAFNTDYPIGDNTELMSVRVRNLKCTCDAPAQ